MSTSTARPSDVQLETFRAFALLRRVCGGPPSGETRLREYWLQSFAICVYAIHRPSGDQVGESSMPGSVVRRKHWLEPGWRTYMSSLSSFSPFQLNAIRPPSGDQAAAVSLPRKLVSGTG